MSSEEREFSPGDQYWSLVEPVGDVIDIYQGPEEFARTFAKAPRVAGLLFAAHFCQSEVCNGGFKQFFSNSTGVLAPEAVEGFMAIGQSVLAETVQKACSLFGEPFPRERLLRQTKLKALDPKLLDALDQRFYDNIDSESGGFATAADSYAARTGKSDRTCLQLRASPNNSHYKELYLPSDFDSLNAFAFVVNPDVHAILNRASVKRSVVKTRRSVQRIV